MAVKQNQPKNKPSDIFPPSTGDLQFFKGGTQDPTAQPLPPIPSQPVAPPATPNAPGTGITPRYGYTLDQIRQFAANPSSIPNGGTYGEGRAYGIADIIAGLRSQIQTGALNVSDYFNIADPLIKQFSQDINISTQGSRQANAINPALQQLQSMGALKVSNGQITSILPFSSREYANLPESVLPTRDEVNSGRIPLDLLPPVQRFRPDTPSTPAPGVGGQPGGAPGSQTGGSTQIPDPKNPGQFINVPIVGDPLQNSVPKTIDQSVIEQESQRQAEQSRQAYEAENAIRTQRLSDLGDLLTKRENTQFSQDTPGIYEDLNSRGLLQSSELGNSLAKERAKLAAASADTLTSQGLTDRDAQIQSISDILGRSQQFQTSGLERRFTLEDFNREQDAAKALGSQYAPSVKSGNSVLSGALGGAATGAAAGAATKNPYVIGLTTLLGAGAGASGKGK